MTESPREDTFWRSVSSTLLDRGNELSLALGEHGRSGRELVEILVERGLISADDLYEAIVLGSRPDPPDPRRPVLYMLPRNGKHALIERDGPAPSRGEFVDLDGLRYVAVRVGSSPLPQDARPCVFLARG